MVNNYSVFVPFSEALSLFDEEKLVFVGEDGRSSSHFVLFSKGKKDLMNCQRAPRTCALLETFPEATSCRRGTIKFSSLPIHTHIAPHVGPTNTKLQILVGLDVDPQGGIRVRMAQDIKLVTGCGFKHVLQLCFVYSTM